MRCLGRASRISPVNVSYAAFQLNFRFGCWHSAAGAAFAGDGFRSRRRNPLTESQELSQAVSIIDPGRADMAQDEGCTQPVSRCHRQWGALRVMSAKWSGRPRHATGR